jgi:hypothetical protein
MWKISAENATWRPLMSFISNGWGNSVLATIALAWSGAEAKASSVYDVGNPNYTSLWIKEENFKDPTDKQYVIAVTTLVGGKYEIAASIEDWAGWFEAAVVWTYTPRATTTTGSIASVDSSNNLIVVEDSIAWFFKKGDSITDWTNDAIISKVSSDWLTLTVDDVTGFAAAWTLTLWANESAWLIDATTTRQTWNIVTYWWTNLPY